MSTLQWTITPVSEEESRKDEDYWGRRRARVPNCMQCGRFCQIISDVVQYNGWINQNYVTFDCKRCGIFTESMW